MHRPLRVVSISITTMDFTLASGHPTSTLVEVIRHKKLINDNATKLANKLATMADQIDSPSDLKTLAEANDRLAITLKVADRHAPKQDINVNATAGAVASAPTQIIIEGE